MGCGWGILAFVLYLMGGAELAVFYIIISLAFRKFKE